jgi:bacterioferritin
MMHAEAIAERVVQLGGEPTTVPGPVTIGHSAEEMLQSDLAQEDAAIELYRRIIAATQGAGDQTTGEMFQSILRDEEAHRQLFSNLLTGD